MSFLSPWFLAGLLAVALPLWLHRLERQAAERRSWSSLAFFRPSTEESIRRRRYRYLLLMACRVLLLAFLALFFARPRVDARSALAPRPAMRHVVAVDTSMSMGHGDTWTRARREAQGLLEALPAGDRSQLVTFGPGVHVLGGATSDHRSWRPALASLSPTGGRGSYGELGEAIRALLPGEATPLTLHVVSDFQRTAAPDRFAELGLPPGAVLAVHDVSGGPRPNWCIEGVAGDRRRYGAEAADLQVTVAGFDTPAAKRRLELSVGDRPVGTAEIDVPASGRATAHFPKIELPRGQSRGVVRMTPADALAADDVFFVALSRADALPVLFLRADTDTRAELYYRAALDAGGAGLFDLHAMTPAAAQSLALDGYAFVVLYDVPRLPPLLEAHLRAFVEGGRSAMVVAGAAVVRERAAPWLAGALAEAERSEHGWHTTGRTGLPLDGDALADVRVFRHVGADASAEETLVGLGDGRPLVFERRAGSGRVMVWTAPFDTAWTDLPVHVAFVPLVLAAGRRLAGLDDAHDQETVGRRLDLGGAADPARASVQVIDPAGERRVRLGASAAERQVVLERAGFYEVRRPGRSEDVAVNADRRESDLRPLERETLDRWKATGGAEPAPVPAPGDEAGKRDLSRAVLWALAAAVVVESTLANRHLRG
jgi:hypothetical protein